MTVLVLGATGSVGRALVPGATGSWAGTRRARRGSGGQADVDTWLPAARALEAASPRVRAYELPTIARLSRLSQAWINTAMRFGVADRHARQQTITLYLDKEPFRDALGVPDEDEIDVLLLDRNGGVLWHKRGRCDEQGARELEAAVQRAIAG